MSWPGPKLSIRATRERTTRQHTDTKVLGVSLEQGFFFALVVLLAPKGAAAGFLPVPDLALG